MIFYKKLHSSNYNPDMTKISYWVDDAQVFIGSPESNFVPYL